MRGTSGQSRQKIVECLTAGPIRDKSGRATQALKEGAGYEGGLAGLSALLLSMEKDGIIRRTTKGKRCFEIALVDGFTSNSAPSSAAPILNSAPSSTSTKKETSTTTISVAEAPPSAAFFSDQASPAAPQIQPAATQIQPAAPPAPAPQAPPMVVDGIDIARLAQVLLDRVIEVAGTPERQAAEIISLRQRVFELTEAAERWRQKVRLMEDELIARKEENRGLRLRMGDVERNLQAVLASANSGIRLDPVRERELRQLVTLMKAPESTR